MTRRPSSIERDALELLRSILGAFDATERDRAAEARAGRLHYPGRDQRDAIREFLAAAELRDIEDAVRDRLAAAELDPAETAERRTKPTGGWKTARRTR